MGCKKGRHYKFWSKRIQFCKKFLDILFFISTLLSDKALLMIRLEYLLLSVFLAIGLVLWVFKYPVSYNTIH